MPTTDTAWPDGTPCWVDYPAPDVDAARAFYGDVLGWTWSGGAQEYGGYDNALLGDRRAAGLYPRMDDTQPPRWLTYFATSDAAAAAARVTAAGGTVVAAPMQLGPLGTMAVALGPQGEAFGLWQAGEHTGVRIYNEPGRWSGTTRPWRTPTRRRPSTARSSASAST